MHYNILLRGAVQCMQYSMKQKLNIFRSITLSSHLFCVISYTLTITVQCSATQCSAVQRSAVQCGLVQCSALQSGTLQCFGLHSGAPQCSEAWRVHSNNYEAAVQSFPSKLSGFVWSLLGNSERGGGVNWTQAGSEGDSAGGLL